MKKENETLFIGNIKKTKLNEVSIPFNYNLRGILSQNIVMMTNSRRLKIISLRNKSKVLKRFPDDFGKKLQKSQIVTIKYSYGGSIQIHSLVNRRKEQKRPKFFLPSESKGVQKNLFPFYSQFKDTCRGLGTRFLLLNFQNNQFRIRAKETNQHFFLEFDKEVSIYVYSSS